MFVRKTLTGLVAVALAGSAVAFAPAPAFADVQPDDTTFTPVPGDLIGVGSDTSQHALKLLADAWNSATPAPASRVATYAAFGGGTIPLPSGDAPRPNGSGSGKALLYGAGNNPDVDFARSSSGPSAAEVDAGLQFFPFALDTLAMAVSNNVPSNAPTSLTPDQIVAIYEGEITNWSEVGGSPGVIAPKTPQPGSGTRSFWDSQLKSMNGGVAVAYAATVEETQEHDDTDVKNDPNAIAPFSIGRAALLGTTLRIEQGWEAKRALYNVVRGADLGDATVQAVFGEDGFVCSTGARELIEEAGFQQLAPPARGGVCGAATQSASSNFTLNEAAATATSLAATSSKAGKAKLVAAVSSTSSPSGSVTFLEGDTVLADGVPLVSGQATYTAVGLTPGTHEFTAVFVPTGGSQFEGSEATDSVLVKAGSQVSETFPKSVAAGKRATGVVSVVLQGIDGTATGKVVVKLGKQTVGSGKLKGGQAEITLDKLPAGKQTLKAVWGGNDVAAGDSQKFTITQK